MQNKRVLIPERLRQVPPQFGWIDRRLLHERHISHCDAPALALYLLLTIVADGKGLSLALRHQKCYSIEPLPHLKCY